MLALEGKREQKKTYSFWLFFRILAPIPSLYQTRTVAYSLKLFQSLELEIEDLFQTPASGRLGPCSENKNQLYKRQ